MLMALRLIYTVRYMTTLICLVTLLGLAKTTTVKSWIKSSMLHHIGQGFLANYLR